MAPPADLAQVAREGFPIIDQVWPGRKRRPAPPPPRREAEGPLIHHQSRPYVYRYTESPLITIRPPCAQTLPPETIIHHTWHQYIRWPSPTMEASRYQDCSGAIDCNKAAALYKGKATAEYGGFY